MPIEIRELIITATVVEQSAGTEAQAATPAASGQSTQNKKELVQECVEQVMDILSKQKRR